MTPLAVNNVNYVTLKKKKIKYSSFIRKFRLERLKILYVTNDLLICG